jgi:uncharacterized RDD family membrane protein YckC
MNDYRHLLSPRMTTIVQDAGFWRRTGAFLIDILILDILVTAPFTALFEQMLRRIDTAGITAVVYTNKELAAIALVFLIAYIYFTLFEYLLSQTPGMMLLGTRAQGMTGIARMLIRNSFLLPFFPFILLWLIEPFAIIIWRRSVLEHLSGTRTIYARHIIL